MNTEDLLAKVQYAFFDVDNTLVGNESAEIPSERFIKAVREAHAAGIETGIASARPLQKVEHILKACSMQGYSILSNGAQIYDGKKQAMVEEHVIPGEVVQRILKELQEKKVDHWVQDDGVDHFWRGGVDYAVADNVWDRADKAKTMVAGYVPNKPFVVMAHNVQPEEKDRLLEEGKRYHSQKVVALILHETHLDDGSTVFDVAFVHERTNKRSALERVLELSGTSKDGFMAVGDGHNDLQIIEHVGVGVAVDNAVESVKKAAQLQVPAWSDDGAAIALEKAVAAKKS